MGLFPPQQSSGKLPTEVNTLLRSMKQLVPNPETCAILSTVGVSYWAYDPVAEEICWQRTDATSAKGYRLVKFSLRNALEYYAQPDRKRFLLLLSDAIEHGLSSPLTATMKTDAGLKTFEIVAARLAGKSIPLVVGVMRECSPEAPKRDELPDMLSNLAHALASVTSAILVTDRNGVIRSANRQFLKLFTVKNSKQIIGRDVRTIPNLLGKKLPATFTKMLADKTLTQGVLKLPDDTGVAKELLFDLHPLALENPKGGCIFVGEVGADSQALPAADILDAVPTPILVADLNSRRIKYANNAGRGELGLSARQIGSERLSDKLMSPTDVRDLARVLDTVGWDAGRVWQVQSHIGLKRHYRIRTCFIGDKSERQIILEFLPVRKETDKPANEKAQNFFSRLLDMNFAK
jgi:PAS domain-containing protein